MRLRGSIGYPNKVITRRVARVTLAERIAWQPNLSKHVSLGTMYEIRVRVGVCARARVCARAKCAYTVCIPSAVHEWSGRAIIIRC